MRNFICRVDEQDRITFVDENWKAFALENDLPALSAGAVLGKSLWNFFSELTTRHLYRVFMHKVRTTGQVVTVPFRCDAPDRRRFMQMTISPLPENALEFRSELVREELRPPVALLDPKVPRGRELIEMCSWCKKVKAPECVEAEEAVARMKLFEHATMPWVSHTICEDCRTSLLQSYSVREAN